MIEELILRNYCNIDSLKVKFNNSINVLFGDNGQGKTNIVSAIYLLSTLRTFNWFRNNQNPYLNLIKDNEDNCLIQGLFNNDNLTKELKVTIVKDMDKSCLVNCFENSKQIKLKQDFKGLVSVYEFSPKDVTDLSDHTTPLKEFIDDELIKLSPSYKYALKKLEKLIKEKNQLLKEFNGNYSLLDTYNDQLSKLNYEISIKRREYLNKINPYIQDEFNKINNESKNLKVILETDFEDLSIIQIKELIDANKDIEVASKKSITSIVYDTFRLVSNGNPINTYFSQGQKRMATISLKLGAIKLYIKEVGKEVITILDDVLSELDETHQRMLINNLVDKGQCFITTTKDLDIFNEFKNISKYEIKNGTIGG